MTNKAWVENNVIRDICYGNPGECYHPDIAKLYSTDVDDTVINGATLVNGEWVNPLPIIAPIVVDSKQVEQDIISKTQARLDDFAQTRGYDNILSACTYATSANAKFASEGRFCVDARDRTWAKLIELKESWDGESLYSFKDIEGLLPVLEWPI